MLTHGRDCCTVRQLARFREGRDRNALQVGCLQLASLGVKGEGTTGDALFMAATVMTGGFPAIFAVPVPRPTGFGFERSDYPDP